MIVAGHQADLLPHSGFWYKLAKADIFDLKIFDFFQPRGFQRRVTMRGRWASIPVIGGPPGSLISEVRIHPTQTRDALIEVIRNRYEGARRWDEVGPEILGMIDQIHTEHLWQFNLHLILGIRDLLGIRTPISIAGPPVRAGDAGLATVMKEYNATTYLSGSAPGTHLGFSDELEEAGIKVRWSRHRALTGDSILSILMDHDDPKAVVLLENTPRIRSVAAGARRA